MNRRSLSCTRAISAAVAKLKETLTGDTLAKRVSADRISARSSCPSRPSPSPSKPSRGRTRTAWARRSTASSKRTSRCGSIATRRPRSSCSPGAGQQHVEIVVSRLKKRYGVEVTLKAPKIPVSRDDPRHRRRPGPPQETDRRPRPVRRLLDQDGAAAARRQVRVRQRDFRRLDSQELHSGRGKGHCRSRRAMASWPASRWWISRSRVYDGSYHDVDSSELAFKLAARKAFKSCHAAGQAGAARADHERRDPGAGGVRRRPDGRLQRAAGASPAWTPRATRRSSAPRSPWRRC